MLDKEIQAVVRRVNKLKKDNQTFLIGIDGGGGAGKSTFAKNLAKELPSSTVVELDDFYKLAAQRVKYTASIPVHINFDRPRIIQEVLAPLKQGNGASYRKYDWQKDRLRTDSEAIPKGGFVIVEGLGALGTELSQYFDFKIWLEATEEKRRKRGIKRDTQEWANIWDEEYLPEDKRYINEQHPQESADIIVNT